MNDFDNELITTITLNNMLLFIGKLLDSSQVKFIWFWAQVFLHKCFHLVFLEKSFCHSDCNLLDYYVRAAIKCETAKSMCSTKDKLKAKIMAPFTNLNKEIIKVYSEDILRPWLNSMAISLNKSNQEYFEIFLCCFDKYNR